jgi:uncharacterized membrane protein
LEEKYKIMKDKVNTKVFGLSGIVWCALAGLLFGCNNIFFKLAFQKNALVTRSIIARHLVMTIGSFFTAKCLQKTSVFSSYNSKNTVYIFLRSLVSCLSKCC